MKLLEHKKITGAILCETGLHIGGAREQMEIGGIDNPVIKHPITGEPYIPGSSLKGKMRSELEKKYDKVGDDGGPCRCKRPDCLVCRIFGPHMAPEHELGPTRILVRDASLNKETRDEYEKLLEEEGRLPVEEKAETMVSRKTGTAQRGTLRRQERVPSGAKFDMEIVIQIFEGDDAEAMLDFVKEGLRLIEASYLGGSGSRGSGKVKFQDLTLDGEGFDL